MKKLKLTACFCAVFLCSFSQNAKKPSNKDLVEFKGFTIHVYKLSSNGYGYDVLNKGAVIQHQNINPYNFSVAGIKLREDAIKTAKWQILQMKPGKKMDAMASQKIPASVARQLNIALN